MAGINPKLPGVYTGRGRALMAMEGPEDAIRYFGEAILLDPMDTESYLDHGDAYSLLSRDDRTLEDYNEAVRIELDKAEAYCQRGLTGPVLRSSSWRWRDCGSRRGRLIHLRAQALSC